MTPYHVTARKLNMIIVMLLILLALVIANTAHASTTDPAPAADPPQSPIVRSESFGPRPPADLDDTQPKQPYDNLQRQQDAATCMQKADKTSYACRRFGGSYRGGRPFRF